jgi:hypothetical protein
MLRLYDVVLAEPVLWTKSRLADLAGVWWVWFAGWFAGEGRCDAGEGNCRFTEKRKRFAGFPNVNGGGGGGGGGGGEDGDGEYRWQKGSLCLSSSGTTGLMSLAGG